VPLHVPVDNWTLSDDALTVADLGWREGDLIECAYAYEYDGEPEPSSELVPYGASDWRWLQTTTHDATLYDDPAFDDSGWGVAPAPFGETTPPHTGPLGNYVTVWNQATRMWARKDVEAEPGLDIYVGLKWNRAVKVWWNGALVYGNSSAGDGGFQFTIPGDQVLTSNLIAVQVTDDAFSGPGTGCYFDLGVDQQQEEA
jgi:hypothetical protein